MKHCFIFWIGIVLWECPIEIAVHLHHFSTHATQRIGRIGPSGTVAASDDHFDWTAEFKVPNCVSNITLPHALDPGEAAARAFNESTGQDDIAQLAHFIGAEGQGLLSAHFYPSPAILIMARCDHRDSGRVQSELSVISHGRQGQANIEDFTTSLHQTNGQSLLDR